MPKENLDESEMLQRKRQAYIWGGLASVAIISSIGYVQFASGEAVAGLFAASLAVGLGATAVAGYRQNLPKNLG